MEEYSREDVALWQDGIEPQGDPPEIGPASYLFEASVAAFSAILQIIAANKDDFDRSSYESLRDEFRKFYMWNEGFSTQTGALDQALSSSQSLKAAVLDMMIHWARTALRSMQLIHILLLSQNLYC
jgi:hypothetical protein